MTRILQEYLYNIYEYWKSVPVWPLIVGAILPQFPHYRREFPFKDVAIMSKQHWAKKIITYLIKKLKSLTQASYLAKRPTPSKQFCSTAELVYPPRPGYHASAHLSFSPLLPSLSLSSLPPTLNQRHLTSWSTRLHLSGAALRPAFYTHWDLRIPLFLSPSLPSFLPPTHPDPEAS